MESDNYVSIFITKVQISSFNNYVRWIVFIQEKVFQGLAYILYTSNFEKLANISIECYNTKSLWKVGHDLNLYYTLWESAKGYVCACLSLIFWLLDIFLYPLLGLLKWDPLYIGISLL